MNSGYRKMNEYEKKFEYIWRIRKKKNIRTQWLTKNNAYVKIYIIKKLGGFRYGSDKRGLFI